MNFLANLKWHQIAISLLIGLALGTAYGQWHAKESFHTQWKKGGMKQHMLKQFNRELHLTADQKKQVSAIFEAKHAQMLALHSQMRPQFEALRNSTQAEIRKILTPEQVIKFDEMNSRMEKRWKEREGFMNS